MVCHIRAIRSLRQKNGSATVALFLSAWCFMYTSCDDANCACSRLDVVRNSRISDALWKGVRSFSSSIILNGSAEGPRLNRSVCLASVALMLPSFELRRKWQDAGTKLHENCQVTTWRKLLQNPEYILLRKNKPYFKEMYSTTGIGLLVGSYV